MSAIIVRFLLGFGALSGVWVAAWSLESRSYGPMFVAAGVGALLSAIASWASVALGKQKKRRAWVFALPFVLPTGASALVTPEGIYRPFVFWCLTFVVAFLAALTTDQLIFRLRREKKA